MAQPVFFPGIFSAMAWQVSSDYSPKMPPMYENLNSAGVKNWASSMKDFGAILETEISF